MAVRIYVTPTFVPLTKYSDEALKELKKHFPTFKVGYYQFVVNNATVDVRENEVCFYHDQLYMTLETLATINERLRAPSSKVETIALKDPATQDQIASIMLQYGTQDQKVEALKYASSPDLQAHATRVGNVVSTYAFMIAMQSMVNRYGMKSTFRFRVKDDIVSMEIDPEDD